MPSVPSVTISGGTRALVISTPLRTPHAEAGARARRPARRGSCPSRRRRRRSSALRRDDAGEHEHRADREVDAGGDDHERHPDRHDSSTDGVGGDVADVVDGRERVEARAPRRRRSCRSGSAGSRSSSRARSRCQRARRGASASSAAAAVDLRVARWRSSPPPRASAPVMAPDELLHRRLSALERGPRAGRAAAPRRGRRPPSPRACCGVISTTDEPAVAHAADQVEHAARSARRRAPPSARP